MSRLESGAYSAVNDPRAGARFPGREWNSGQWRTPEQIEKRNEIQRCMSRLGISYADAARWLAGGQIEQLQARVAELEREDRERRRVASSGSHKEAFSDKQRQEIRERDKVCQIAGPFCAGPLWPTAWLQCDHVDPDGPNETHNGQGACPNCHDTKTREEQEARRAVPTAVPTAVAA